MTKRLEQLYLSFSNIIMDYCDTQLGSKSDPCEGAHPSISYLERQIQSTAESHANKTVNRVPLLNYLLYGVTLLNPLIEPQDSRSLSETEDKHLRTELVRMLRVMQQLLHLSQRSQCQVHYREHQRQNIALYGCLRLGGLLSCTSGRIIKTKLFLAINLSIDVHESKIEQYIDDAINEYQCELLLEQTKRLRAANRALLSNYNDKTLELSQAKDDIFDLTEGLIKSSLKADSSVKMKKKSGETEYSYFSFFQPRSDSDDIDSPVSVKESYAYG